MGLLDRLRNAWNAFIDNDKTTYPNYYNFGLASSSRPDRTVLSRGNEKSIISSVYNRIALDCSSVTLKHVKIDENNRYIKDIDSDLNNCLSLESNKDQTSRAFIQDVVLSLFDEGCIAIVPIDTDTDVDKNSSYKIYSLRVGKITQWFPDHVQIEVYNDRKGIRQEIVMPKSSVAIIENPMYAITNERNSTLQRLIRKLNLLDVIDEQSSSGKLDLIIQLPYVIKTDARREQAELRRKDIENQLAGSKYGIAYTDGTEKITQLNRPVENNLMKQIEFLTSMLYSQLGITQAVLDGTADDKTMTNYLNRTVVPIMAAIADEMTRKFLTKTARSQYQRITYFNDPFKLIPVTSLAEIADKFTRNEVMSSNEIRQIVGMKPVDDARADELRNKNISVSDDQSFANTRKSGEPDKFNYDEGENQNG